MTMITYSIIKKTQLEDTMRIDAEFYAPIYLETQRIIESFRHATLLEISKKIVNFGAYSLTNQIEYLDEGVPFLHVGNITDSYIDLSDVKYIDEELSRKILHKSLVSEGQVLLTIAGTIGNAAVATGLPENTNSNQAIANIYPEENINPFYLSSFLNCKYGKLQSQRYIISNVQPNLLLTQVKKFLIPIPSNKIQDEISLIVKDALASREKSLKLYSRAENLLLEELGLADFEAEDELSYIVNLSEVKSANRVDAEYFQPKYKNLEFRIKNYGAKKLGDIIENVPARFNLKPDENYRYVELANINSSIGVIDGFLEILGKEAPSRAKRVLKSGDVIVSSVEGSLEKVAFVDKEQNGHLASTGFFQFRSKEILPEFLLILAKSLVFQMQLQKQTTGTILTAVPKEAIKNVLVPVLPKPSQQKIAALVQKSHVTRKKSKELLEEAKRRVEKIIEEQAERIN